MKFTKMHGNGNDFIIIDEFNKVLVPEERKAEFSKWICNRNFAVGADGVIFVQASEIADARARFFNPDGSEARMCGNGIRCFSRFIVEEGYAEMGKLRVETLAGIKELEIIFDGRWWIKVDMGKPEFEASRIPSSIEVWGLKFGFEGLNYILYAVNTGVPHVVTFVDNLDFDIIPIARKIRYSEIFPEGTNVNFARFDGRRFYVRTYERGVESETLSCGTGSVAVVAVAKKLGIAEKAEVLTKGGTLKIEVGERAFMTGSATRIFDAEMRDEV
ncbi:MAG: diaminopimelate epimerase [Archaeoglobaceae archaeon]|nr:diaminopimelate epimerase [Archaeoglobaceae archaeon]MDW7989248.1 diaminopimelate epimerase [Archaeoglobaceae archaeon]